MSNFIEEDGKNHNPLVVFRMVGGESATEQAIQLAWYRHNFIVGEYFHTLFTIYTHNEFIFIYLNLATPGRLAMHIKESDGFARHHLSTVKHLVLDEADRIFSLEFAEDLDLLLNLFQRPMSTKANKTLLDRRANLVAETNPEEKEKGMFSSP